MKPPPSTPRSGRFVGVEHAGLPRRDAGFALVEFHLHRPVAHEQPRRRGRPGRAHLGVNSSMPPAPTSPSAASPSQLTSRRCDRAASPAPRAGRRSPGARRCRDARHRAARPWQCRCRAAGRWCNARCPRAGRARGRRDARSRPARAAFGCSLAITSAYLPCGTKQMSWLSGFSATIRPNSRASSRVALLGKPAERKAQKVELLLRGREQEIALVAARRRPAGTARAGRWRRPPCASARNGRWPAPPRQVARAVSSRSANLTVWLHATQGTGVSPAM